MGMTPLLLACSSDNTKLAKFLLSAGADVNSADAQGVTALMLATEKRSRYGYHGPILGDAVLIRLLVRCNADIHARCKGSGRRKILTAFDLATEGDEASYDA